MPNHHVAVLAEALAPLELTVLPSSVCPGFGVYALRRIPRGTILGEYPGLLISDRADSMLRRLLRGYAREADPSADAGRAARVQQYFGLSIEQALPPRWRRHATLPLAQDAPIEWRRVLDTVYAYSFQTDCGTLVPQRISAAGPPLYDMDAHEKGDTATLTPFINEAPPGKFRNRLTGNLQSPLYSVDVRVERERVVFYAKRTILPGSELFFFYGPTYYRKYEINMLPAQCGWGQSDYDDADDEERQATVKFLRRQLRFQPPEGLSGFINDQRKLEMKVNIKRLLRT